MPVHATLIAIGDAGVLLRGPSGCGKSDTALRLLDRGASLVSDDQVILERRKGTLFGSAPAPIKGKLEVRGVGIIDVPVIEIAPVVLCVDLIDRQDEARLPEPDQFVIIDGVKCPSLKLDGLNPSTVLKIEIKLKQLMGEKRLGTIY